VFCCDGDAFTTDRQARKHYRWVNARTDENAGGAGAGSAGRNVPDIADICPIRVQGLEGALL